MGRIPEEDIVRVRDATDIVSFVSESVVLKKKGRLFWGLCPFHSEKTPSFKVDPATQLWHCFGCGAGGDVFGFAMQRERLEFPESVRMLADRARIEIREEGESVPRGKRERLAEACKAAADFYHHTLTRSKDKDAEEAREYLASRGFGSDVARRFTLGFAPGDRKSLVKELVSEGFTATEMVEANLAYPPESVTTAAEATAEGVDEGGEGATWSPAQLKDRFFSRVMFPIRDLNGRSVAFGGRVLGKGEPKYLNSTDTPIFHKSAHLYAIDKAKASIVASERAVVVEGYTDVIALHEAGITNVVATLGTALTDRHVKLLGRFAKRVVYVFDGDEAGLRAADRAAEFVDAGMTPESGSSRVEVFVAVIPEGMDPADYVSVHGAEATDALIDSAEPLLRFAIERRLAANDLSTPGGRAKALAEAAEVVAPVKGSILGHDYANYLADRLGVDFAVARAAIDKVRVRPRYAEQETVGAAGTATAAQDAPEVLDAGARAERALVGLVAASPELRDRARSLLETDLLSDLAARTLLEIVANAGRIVEGELVRMVAEHDEKASSLLAGLVMDVPPLEDRPSAAREIVRKLKELALERQIKQDKVRYKESEAAGDKAAADALFTKIAAMQLEHEAIRRGAMPPGLEEWDR